jgi:hypothetical protein
LCWVNLATYQDISPYLSPAIFVTHYTLIPSNPEEPNQITGIVGGYKKPVELLIAAFIFFVLGVIIQFKLSANAYILFLLAIIIAVTLIIQYLYGKPMNLGVQNGGDKVYGLEFKKGLIEGIEVDVNLVRESIKLLNDAVLKS